MVQVIEPSVELVDAIDREEIIRKLESAARTCYKSEPTNTVKQAGEFIEELIARRHESVIEHVSITFRIVCDRGVSHELVRHRIASYSQESTRYCDYSGELTVIMPTDIFEAKHRSEIWYGMMQAAERAYQKMREQGVPPETARSVLPNSLATEIVATMNLRQWRHFIKMRADNSRAHPDMRRVAKMIKRKLNRELPEIFW